MRFVWEEKKNRSNIKRHVIDFNDVIDMFDYPILSCIDKREDYGEERCVGIGFLKGIIAVIVYNEDDEKDIIRIISVRKATKNEKP